MIISELQKIAGKENVLRNEPLSRHTTFRIGGPCRAYVTPENEAAFLKTVAFLRAKNEPFFVIGRGSNLLVSDHGFPGIVISLREKLRDLRVEGETVTAAAGVLLSELSREALRNGLSGLEFASGIPGTVGGALLMNAGAYGSEMKDVVVSTRVLMPSGEIREFSNEELELRYRHSALSENGGIVLSAVFRLEKGEPEAIRTRMDELNAKRREKQPLEYGSAGSTFKRPQGYFAGKLIEDAGLKGLRIGDAAVSEKHAGFIVNLDHATARDTDELIRTVIAKVQAHSGVTLEPEVLYLGDF